MRAPSPLFLSLGFCLFAGAASAAVSLDGLATDSPFVLKKDDASAAPVVTENATVEFRGMIATKEGVLFGFFDRTKNTSAWVKQNDKNSEFNVRSFDATVDTVSLDYQGQKFTLPLSTAKIATAVAAPVQIVNNAQPGMPQPNVTAQPANRVQTAQDQQRLESVAAEVRRRRALRQAATGANGQTTPAPAAQNNGARQ